MRGVQDQAGLLGVVLLGGHEHRAMAAQIAALADEREHAPGGADAPAPVGVERLSKLPVNLAFRGSILA